MFANRLRYIAAAAVGSVTVGLAWLQRARQSGPLERHGINICAAPDAGFVLQMEAGHPRLHISDIRADDVRLPEILNIVERYAATEGYSVIDIEDAASFEDMYLARQLRAVVGREPLSIYTRHGFVPVNEHASMSRDKAMLRKSTIGEWRDELRKCNMFVPPEFAPRSARLSSFIEYDKDQRKTVAPAEVKLLLRRMAIEAINGTCAEPLFSAARRIASGPTIKMRKVLPPATDAVQAVGAAVDQLAALKANVALECAFQDRAASQCERLEIAAVEEYIARLKTKNKPT